MESDKHPHDFSSQLPEKDFFKALEKRLSAIPSQKNQNWHSDLRDKNLFHVPNGYFDSLEARLVLSTKSSQNQSKNLPFKTITWTRFAAAASILLIGISAFLYVVNTPSVNLIANELETVSDTEIIAYLENSGTGNFILEDFETLHVPVSNDLDGIEKEDLKKYADEYGI